VSGNPVDGVKRPMANGNEGSTPALGDAQARKLLEAPAADTLKGARDRAILATLLYHGIRRDRAGWVADPRHAQPSGRGSF
jgi:integrase/recombinase XerD